jgi:cytochrome c2
VATRATALGLAAGLAVVGAGEPKEFEGNPFRGRTLFVEKHCVRCHSIWGHGGTLGPEIAQVVARRSLPQLAGAFWNHTPRMIEEMADRGYGWPMVDRDEMADLLRYLYYLRLFDEPGDSARGAMAFTRLRCEFCHAVGGKGGVAGPPLDHFAAHTSPIPLAQAMWNSGPDMQETQIGSGTPIPEFSGSEMVDIQAYIRERGLQREPGPVEMLSLPNPVSGAKVFRDKGCPTCHFTGKAGAPDFGDAALRMTMAEISGVLWNHSYAMQDQMRAAGIPFPRFSEYELADVLSYIRLLGYRGSRGDASRGAGVFRDKGCAVCHEYQRVQAPDLSALHPEDDAIGLSAAMWNHAPEMHEVMAEYGMPWPKFEEGDMEDLVAFLRGASRAGPP